MIDYSLEAFQNGQVLLIDKPLKWTSFDVVNKLRYNIKKKYNIKKIKVGHAGTLDPLATGLLIICTGKFTKQIEQYQAQIKRYTGIITLGATTPSFDLESEIDKTFNTTQLNIENVQKAANSFLGNIQQFPPIFSAIKVDGKRAYDYAREGEEVKLKSREIEIKKFDIISFDDNNAVFDIICSKGTYIRSLARDLGEKLDNGGHLTKLRRENIGDFDVNNAISIDEFIGNIVKY